MEIVRGIVIEIDTLKTMKAEQLRRILETTLLSRGEDPEATLPPSGSQVASKMKALYIERLEFMGKGTMERGLMDFSKFRNFFGELMISKKIRRHINPESVKKLKNLYADIRVFVGLARKVIKGLGVYPTRGVSEAMYQKCFIHELQTYYKNKYGSISEERWIDIYYPPKPAYMTQKEALIKNYKYLGRHNRLDVEFKEWIIEMKSLEVLGSECGYQLLNYIRQTEYEKGLIINFKQSGSVVEWKFIKVAGVVGM